MHVLCQSYVYMCCVSFMCMCKINAESVYGQRLQGIIIYLIINIFIMELSLI